MLCYLKQKSAVFSSWLHTLGGCVPSAKDTEPFFEQLFALLDAHGFPKPLAGRGTIGATRGGLTTFYQPLVFTVEDAERLEERFGGCLRDGIEAHGKTFRADFQRIGGPRSETRLVLNVPDHFPAAEVQRLLSTLPHVASVTLSPAYDSLGLRRTAYLAHFRIVGPLPREVHLFAPGGTPLRSLDGRPCLPLRLDVGVSREAPARPCPPALRIAPT